MEGIETSRLESMDFIHRMSVGAPTWRGLKQAREQVNALVMAHVSRCPDMEGIETLPYPKVQKLS